MGFTAAGINLFESSVAAQAAGCLYLSGICWTVLYDIIYAHQDIKDDKKAGVMSTAVKHADYAKLFLTMLGVAQVAMLALVSWFIDVSEMFYVGTYGGTTMLVGLEIMMIDLEDPKNRMWWFTNGSWMMGCTTASGFLFECLESL